MSNTDLTRANLTDIDGPQAELALRRKKALYRAMHRGTKEMDWLLGRFAAAQLPDMSTADLEIFEKMLSISDPELHNWILQPDLCRLSEFGGLLRHIRLFHQLET